MSEWLSNAVEIGQWRRCLSAAKSLQLYLTLCDPMDCSPPGSSVHGISQARILECVGISSSRGSSRPRDETQSLTSPELSGEFFITKATWGEKVYRTPIRLCVVDRLWSPWLPPHCVTLMNLLGYIKDKIKVTNKMNFKVILSWIIIVSLI